MSTYNTPLVGGGNQPGTIDNAVPFPELYIRNFVNDEGILPSEATPLQRVVDMFTVQADQLQFTLSKVPGQEYSPIVYLNGAAQTPTVNYVINSRTVTFPADVLQTGDKVQVNYYA